MIGRGVFLLILLSNCVLSLPVTSSQLENEDVEVVKCVVEALADVLSRPHHVPISQECLVTLKTDDRLVTILRHHNFLKELQEVALQGGQLQKHADPPTLTTPAPRTTDDFADRSMLEALGGPGERSILSQRKSAGKGDGREGVDESADDSRAEEEQVKREKDVSRGDAVKSEEEEEEAGGEEDQEKRANSEENYSERENETRDKKGDRTDGKRDVSTSKAEKRTFEEEEEGDNDKHSQKHKREKEVEEEEGVKRGLRENLKRWTKRAKPLQLKKKKRVETESQLPSNQKEVPHHSKEIADEDEEEEKKKRDPLRSPEEKELQMIARRAPEERKGMEEEGSASRKPEEPEIESLAAIESELENVAQKLHELRRG